MDRFIDVGLFDRLLQHRLDNAHCRANGGGACIKTEGLKRLKRIESIVGFIDDRVDAGAMELNRRKRWALEDVPMKIATEYETTRPCGNRCPARHFCLRDSLRR